MTSLDKCVQALRGILLFGEHSAIERTKQEIDRYLAAVPINAPAQLKALSQLEAAIHPVLRDTPSASAVTSYIEQARVKLEGE